MKKTIYKALSIAQFKKLTVANKRITIAKDVIAAIRSHVYEPETGKYIHLFQVKDKWWSPEDYENTDIQKELPKMKRCEVCAMGSCILSITKYENKLQFNDVGRNIEHFTTETSDLIAEVFTPEQFAMIEIMFEGEYTGVCYRADEEVGQMDNYGRDKLGAKVSDNEAIQCIKFKRRFKRDRDRLIAIMTHIIDMKGDVVPEKMNKPVKKK